MTVSNCAAFQSEAATAEGTNPAAPAAWLGPLKSVDVHAQVLGWVVRVCRPCMSPATALGTHSGLPFSWQQKLGLCPFTPGLSPPQEEQVWEAAALAGPSTRP